MSKYTFLLMAVRNIDRLAEMVNDILDLSKIEAGKILCISLLLLKLDPEMLQAHPNGSISWPVLSENSSRGLPTELFPNRLLAVC